MKAVTLISAIIFIAITISVVAIVYQSGSVSMTGRTGKMSNSHLRTTMFLVSQVCARYGPEGLKEFHRRVREKKGYHVATIALARRLMVIMWKMLKEGESFKDESK